MTPANLESALSFLATHYNPVGLQDVLALSEGRGLPPRPVLVTFDDDYCSAREWAAPLCQKYRIPAIFSLNAAFLDNHRLAPDNLVCFIANVLGMETINAAARIAKGDDSPKLNTMADVFSSFFPSISLSERGVFLDAMAHIGGISERQLAEEARLYMTRKQVNELASSGFEIGNHTYTHVRCRSLIAEDLAVEVDRNREELEAVSGKKVRSFSVPYGSSQDLTGDLVEHLKLSGHAAAFLSESSANSSCSGPFRLDRVSVHADGDDALFLQIEVLPRLRTLRNRVSHALDTLRFGVRGSSSGRLDGPRGSACIPKLDRIEPRM